MLPLIRHKTTRIGRAAALLVLGTSLAACVAISRTGGGAGVDLPFNGERAVALVAEQTHMGPRYPGSPGHVQVRKWIAEQLERRGWRVTRQAFQIDGIALENMRGTVAAVDEDLLIAAHFDTRPVADQDPQLPELPVVGANDGASGVAVLLELARVLPSWEGGCRPGLVFFDAEDSGGLNGWDWHEGASHYVDTVGSLPAALVVVDMVGDRDLQIFYDRNSDPILKEQIWAQAADLGYSAFIPENKYAMVDDHKPFADAGVASVLLIDFDYPFWHTTEDTLDKVSADSLAVVGRTLQAWLMEGCPELSAD